MSGAGDRGRAMVSSHAFEVGEFEASLRSQNHGLSRPQGVVHKSNTQESGPLFSRLIFRTFVVELLIHNPLSIKQHASRTAETARPEAQGVMYTQDIRKPGI